MEKNVLFLFSNSLSGNLKLSVYLKKKFDREIFRKQDMEWNISDIFKASKQCCAHLLFFFCCSVLIMSQEYLACSEEKQISINKNHL